MKVLHLLSSTAVFGLSTLGLCQTAFAQVDISDARTTGVATSTAGANNTPSDINIASGGSVNVTTGAAVTMDTDNSVTNAGAIGSNNADDTTGVLISGMGGDFTNTGSITMTADAPTGGITPTSDIITGTGRTGILISGANYSGNVTNSGNMTVRGNNSNGISLSANANMTGNITHRGTMTVLGANSNALEVAGNLTGDLVVNGSIGATGENTSAIAVSGDINGGVQVNSLMTVSGFLNKNGQAVTARPALTARRAVLSEGNLHQAGSALNISANISQGIHFARATDANGRVTSRGGINMLGSAPAVLIDGNGTPIAIGLVGQITDPNDENYDEDLQYAFVNQGTLVSDGFLNDADATTFELRDANLQGGLNNTGTMRATVYRSGIDPSATAPTPDAHARVIVIGGGGIAERINNSGAILARGFEAADEVYEDRDNIPDANLIRVTAIDILAGGNLQSLENRGRITAIVTGRRGEVVAIRDASGTLRSLNNQGTIEALGENSDTTGAASTNFNLIALDVSANTNGFTLNQSQYDDPNVDDDPAPSIRGDILLGSGADVLNIAAGSIEGDIAFGAGADRLAVSGDGHVTGSLSDSDGQLDIQLADNAVLTITGPANYNVTSASFNDTATYSPFIDPATGDSSVMIASGTVSFADGTSIAPRLGTVLANPSTSFTIVQAGTLNLGANFGTGRGTNSPYLYNTSLARDPNNPNTLIMTLDLRNAQELGLDQVQEAAFAAAFEALRNSDALGAAFVGLTDETSFFAAYNQLLPEFSGAARHFVLANVDGATGAVGSHLDTARRSQDKPGGLWIEEFAYFADKSLSGRSEQFRGFGFGVTGGFDTALGPFHTLGLNLGFATTEVEDVLGVDKPLDVLTIQGGVYGGLEFGGLGVDLYAGGGYNDFEANRKVIIGSFNEAANGNWSGTHYNASATAGYNIKMGKIFVRPSASISYLNINEKSFAEDGSSLIALSVDSRKSEIGTATAIMNIGTKWQKKRMWVAPSLRLGVRNDFLGDSVLTTGHFVNGNTPFALQSDPFPNTGLIFGLGLAAGSQYSSFGLNYDADVRDGFIRHTARIVFRLIF